MSSRGSLGERLWAKIHITEPEACWVWIGAIKKSTGYGDIAKGDGSRKNCTAHRAFYKLFVDPNIDGLGVDHLCTNRWRMNPQHLEAVPSRINTLRGNGITAKNARKTHCSAAGHPLSGDNLCVVKSSGQRNCRECRRTRWRSWYYQRKADGLGCYSGSKNQS